MRSSLLRAVRPLAASRPPARRFTPSAVARRRGAGAPPPSATPPASSATTGDRVPPLPPPPAPPHTGPPRVCVLGGGFGGLYTAVRLESLLWPSGKRPSVTLIDRGDRFVFKPLLYELLAGTATDDEVAPPFARLLAPYRHTQFVQGSVARVEEGEAGGRVVLTDGASIDYDWLVLALGAETATFGVPGAREHCLAFNTYDDARALDAALQSSGDRATAAVVGGGYAGVELAAVLGERLGPGAVSLVCSGPTILEAAPPGQRDAATAKLAAVGVSVVTGAAVTKVGKKGGGGVELTLKAGGGDGTAAPSPSLAADVAVWTAGVRPAGAPDAGKTTASTPLTLPFPRTRAGAVSVEPSLRVAGHPRAFAVGDVAGADGGGPDAPPGRPPTAQVAFQQADYAAWNVWASVVGRPLLPFKYQHLGEMMSLGAADGALTLPVGVPASLASALTSSPLAPLLDAAGVRLGDPGGLTLAGPLAGALRRAAYWYRQPTGGQRAAVGAEWLGAAAKRVGGRRGESK